MNVAFQDRSFVRHPTDIPLDIEPDAPCCRRGDVRNLSQGGLAFASPDEHMAGSDIWLCIRCRPSPLKVRARVVWCRPEGAHFEVGVAFLTTNDAYQVRMVEQICQIEQYRRDAWRREGRSLTQEEAAREWINQYASSFAQDDWSCRDN